ncbi:MarR family winged helix-turn-helix transcriptional regulator [Actinoallomurus iriomotensis]|uniref:MarR family transcriptional regulator n=1 Tax=Actinoallomurus iriomotensis TaxID=478107 RepID=A0A9W6RSN3_9ACTN|nr:MarR family winged helix-turn-helix transcriptional regulator [Actinoallomurus iriomotensis]GLY80998.1 MarR family transcriptional regulator [Actinoallomurus iriomotensis]
MPRTGADLALLLLAGFRSFADAATAELARRGYPGHRPLHDFAMHAMLSGADNAAELGRRLSISKQAAAKIINVLEERGYVAREPDPADGRRKRLRITPRGSDLLREGEEVFEGLRRQWEQRIGTDQLKELEERLTELVGAAPMRFDTLGWMAEGSDGRS